MKLEAAAERPPVDTAQEWPGVLVAGDGEFRWKIEPLKGFATLEGQGLNRGEGDASEFKKGEGGEVAAALEGTCGDPGEGGGERNGLEGDAILKPSMVDGGEGGGEGDRGQRNAEIKGVAADRGEAGG